MVIEIVHLQQLRADSSIPQYDENTDSCNEVVASQFEVATYLKDHLDAPVLDQSLSEDISCENSQDICSKAKQIFAFGLPDYIESLSYLQKTMLYQYGAAITLTYMGILPKTYKSLGNEKIIPQGNLEYLALENAQLAAVEYYGEAQGEVFLCFDENYDFKQACDVFNYPLTEIDLAQGYQEYDLNHNSKESNLISSITITIPVSISFIIFICRFLEIKEPRIEPVNEGPIAINPPLAPAVDEEMTLDRPLTLLGVHEPAVVTVTGTV